MSELLNKVAEFSKKAHEGQYDKGGHPYYLHPEAVAAMGKTENEKIVGYLHDVIEDTNYTIDDLKALGVNDECLEAIKTLTHDKNISYEDYIKNIKKCELARKVKINDLTNNMDLSRLKEVTQKDLDRVDKYKSCLKYLSE
ncbi:MAG: GTP pyrophosphokinase [Anaeroplasmataceae bacterium]